MAWRDIDDSEVDPESPVTTSLAQAWRDNPVGIANGDSGAPRIQQGAIDSGAVGQGELKTALAELSTSSGDDSFTESTKLLPDPQYSFFPATRWSYPSSTNSSDYTAGAAMTGGEFGGFSADYDTSPYQTYAYARHVDNPSSSGGTTYEARMYHAIEDLSADDVRTAEIYTQVRYVQASPPYDLGDGEIPLFVFLELTSDGEVVGVYVAEDPPWAFNGPTDIHRPVLDNGEWRERSVEEKNADIDLVPHPFLGSRRNGNAIQSIPLLIEPTGNMVEELHRRHRETGDSIPEMIHKGYLRIDNDDTKHNMPSGVLSARARHRKKKDPAPSAPLDNDRISDPVVTTTTPDRPDQIKIGSDN